jgi:glycosyltransferase involved in cell wall biosynthesis
MCNSSYVNNVFFLADCWGAAKGGINVVNYDLANAFGRLANEYRTQVYCVVSGTVSEKLKNAAATNNVTLISIDPEDFSKNRFGKLKQHVSSATNLYWIGHDIITGNQATACKDTYGGTLAIFHHMNYESYYSAKGSGVEVKAKCDSQKEILSKADVLIAVGDKLLDSLNDIVPDIKPKERIIPGLADITPKISSPKKLRMVSSGRIEGDNDSIKQFGLSVQAFCELIKNNDVERDDSNLTLWGLSPNDTETEIRLREAGSQITQGHISINCLPYTTDRNILFQSIKDSSVFIMPSLSEGFGLVGLEAISAGVPLIVSKHSGLYEFLENEKLDNYVKVINVQGDIGGKTNPNDIKTLNDILKNMLRDMPKYKNDALRLREKLLENDVTWESAAKSVYKIMGIRHMNDIAWQLYNVISVDVKKVINVCEIANVYGMLFIDRIASKFKIDKQALSSLKADTFGDIVSGIVGLMSENGSRSIYRAKFKLKNIYKDVFRQYIHGIIKEIKQSAISDAETILLSEFIIIDKSFDEDFRLDIDRDFFLWDRPDSSLSEEIEAIASSERFDAMLSLEDKEVISSYYDELKQNNDSLDFEGLSTMISSNAQKIPLNSVFAEVSLLPLQSGKKQTDWFWLDVEDYDSFNAQLRLLKQNKRTVILGDPGTGKSTLVKKRIIDLIDNWQKCKNIPYTCVTVRIADYSNSVSLSLDQFIKHKLASYKSFDTTKLIKIYEKLQRTGNIIYFIDGLDEVKNSNEKSKVRKNIAALLGIAKECIFVVTSRKVGFDDSLTSLGFNLTEIAPLSRNVINSYIKSWFATIREFSKEKNENFFINRAEKLTAIIANDRALSDLAQNPLLLSILVILHYRGISLPNSKADIYGVIAKTLLETWIENKGVVSAKYNTRYLTDFFGEVGYYIVDKSYDNILISETTLRKLYAAYAKEVGSVSAADEESDIDDFISYISESVGILLVKGTGDNEERLYGFLTHRQFTEYFAALGLEGLFELGSKSIKDIMNNDPRWIEVFTLMGSYMTGQNKGGVLRINARMQELLQFQDIKPMSDLMYNVQLVLHLLSNNVNMNRDTESLLVNHLDSIFSSNNHYRIIHLSDDILRMLSSCHKGFVCNLLVKYLLSGDYQRIRNAAIILNIMIKSKELHKESVNAIYEQTGKKFIDIIGSLFVNEMPTWIFYKEYGLFHSIFENHFVEYTNRLDFNSISEEYKEKVFCLVDWFAHTNMLPRDIGNKESEREHRIFERLKWHIEQSKLFTNEQLSSRAQLTTLLDFFKSVIAKKDSETLSIIEKYNEDIGIPAPLIISAKQIVNTQEFSLEGISAITYVNAATIIYHNKNKSGHQFIILSLNRETCRFEIESFSARSVSIIEEKCSKLLIFAKIPNIYLPCLLISEEISDSAVIKRRIFTEIYQKNLCLLDSEEWKECIREHLVNNHDLLYEKYDDLIRMAIFIDFPNKNNLEGLLKICCNIFDAGKKLSSRPDDVDLLLKLYNEAPADSLKKNVIYDIIYRGSSPFKNNNQTVASEVEF